MRPLVVRWLGRLPYAPASALQDRLVAARQEKKGTDTLLLLEHPPVITLGRSSDPAHVLISPAERAARGIELHEAGRGGDVTYHGPGQLVGYPIVALVGERRDAHRYLRDVEEILIGAAADFGVRARRDAGLTGIWVGDRKLGAIGVRISTGWIASHGFALNVATDLSAFDAIVPCGLRGCRMTSLEELTGRRYPLEEVAARAALRVADVLGLDPVVSDEPAERLTALVPAAISVGRLAGAASWEGTAP